MARDQLNAAQLTFVNALLAGKSKKEAAIEAGRAAKSAAQTASKWLKMAKVQAALEAGQQSVSTAAAITAADVLRELALVAFLDPTQAYGVDGQLLPVAQMPDPVRRALAGFEEEAEFEDQPTGELGPRGGVKKERVQIGVTRKVRWWDKLKALELIGKNLGMFNDRITVELAELLNALEKRAREHGHNI